MKMKFFVFSIAALVAATSSNCIAATSRKRKIAKKVGATGQADGDLIPIRDTCTCPEDCEFSAAYDTTTCQSRQPGSFCRPWESDCVVQNDLDPPHGVCRGPNSKCQRGVKGDYCGQNSDCRGNMKCHGVTQSARCR